MPRPNGGCGPARTYDSPTCPRSSAATIPSARSSTCTQPDADVVERPVRAACPSNARWSCSRREAVVVRAVDLARHDDDDRGALPRSAPPRPRARGTSSRRRSRGSPRRGRGGTSRRRRAVRVAEHVDGRHVHDPRRRARPIAASSTRSVAPTFASHIAGRSERGIPIRYLPATWISASAPRIASSRPPASARLDRTSVIDPPSPPPCTRCWAVAGSRTRRHVVAAMVQPLDDGPPDEPGPAGHDDAHQVGPGPTGRRPCRPSRSPCRGRRASSQALMSRRSAAPPAPSLARWSMPRTMFITGRIAITSPSSASRPRPGAS